MSREHSSRVSRRAFLTGSAASMAAGPAFAQRTRGVAAGSGEVDCIVVGAGAAGIASARRLRELGRSVIVVEASSRIGGRCIVDTKSFSVPFDRGAHLIHSPDTNPLAKLAARTGLEVYTAPTGQRIRIGRRNAREGELEGYLTASVRANRAIADATRGGRDPEAASVLPRDLGEWDSTVRFALGPYTAGKDLSDVSAGDLSRAGERDNGAYCRQGFGALLGKLAEGLPVQLDTAVRTVDASGRVKVEAATSKGTLTGRFMIITASTTAVLDKIKFDGGLPKRQQDAMDKLKLGSFDHIAIEMNGNPLGLNRDDLVFEKSTGPRTAALLANVGGSSLSVVEVAGSFGRTLAGQGEKAMTEFAVEWLSGLFGTEIKKAIARTQVTQWNNDPWSMGAFSCAAPGGQWARRALMEPIRNRVFFAGEAVHETLWGTVDGAWESGVRAAEMVNRRVLGQPDPPPPKAEIEPPPPVRKGKRS
jgi:monoamine oxidase